MKKVLKRSIIFLCFLFFFAAANDFETVFTEPADYSLNEGDGSIDVLLWFNESGSYGCEVFLEAQAGKLGSSGNGGDCPVDPEYFFDLSSAGEAIVGSFEVPPCSGGRHSCWHELKVFCERDGECESNSSKFHYYPFEEGCTDFDEGEPFEELVLSSCVDAGGINYDYCDGSALNEFYCSGKYCVSREKECSDGCSSGACIFEAPDNPFVCLPSDGGVGGEPDPSDPLDVLLEVDYEFDLGGYGPFTVRDWSYGSSLWLEYEGASVFFEEVGDEALLEGGGLRVNLEGFDSVGLDEYAKVTYTVLGGEEDSDVPCLEVSSPLSQPYFGHPQLEFQVLYSVGGGGGPIIGSPAYPSEYDCLVSLNGAERETIVAPVNEVQERDTGSYATDFRYGENELEVSCSREDVLLESLIAFRYYPVSESVEIMEPEGRDYPGETPRNTPFKFVLQGANLYECRYGFFEVGVEDREFKDYPYQIPGGYEVSGSWSLPQGEYDFVVECSLSGTSQWDYSDSVRLSVYTDGAPEITAPSTDFVWDYPFEIGFEVYGGEFDCSYSLDGESKSVGEVSSYSEEVSARPGEHEFVASCGDKKDSAVFVSGLEGEPVIYWPANHSNHSYSGADFDGQTVEFYFVLDRDAECEYRVGEYEGSFSEKADEPQSVSEGFPEGEYSFELECGELPKKQIDFTVEDVQELFVNAPSVREPAVDAAYKEPGFGLRFTVDGSYQEYSCVPSVKRTLGAGGNVDEEPEVFDAVKASNTIEFKDLSFFTGFETGKYDFILNCSGLKDGEPDAYNAAEFSFGVELVEVEEENEPVPAPVRLPATPTVKPAATPAPKPPSFVIDCPKRFSKDASHVFAVLEDGGEPSCDESLSVEVFFEGSPVEASLVSCASGTGKHDVLIDSSGYGSYEIELSSGSLSDSCTVKRVQSASGEEDEAPALPLLFALAVAAFAFVKRRQ